MRKLADFFSTWWLYAKYHNPVYAARIAYGIVYRNLPF